MSFVAYIKTRSKKMEFSLTKIHLALIGISWRKLKNYEEFIEINISQYLCEVINKKGISKAVREISHLAIFLPKNQN